MSAIPFRVLNSYESGGGHTITNEEPEIHRRLLRGRKFNKVLSISSGGEVPLLVLLPITKTSLVAVDHSLSALGTAYAKATILAHYGPNITYEMFCGDELRSIRLDRIMRTLAALKEYIPIELRTHVENISTYHSGESMLREWRVSATPSALAKSYVNIPKLSFVHGDVTDLADSAPFDFLYMSNAFGHTNRDSMKPDPEKVASLLGSKGLAMICTTSSSPSQSPLPYSKIWFEVKNLQGNMRNSFDWTYRLCKVVRPKNEKAPKNLVTAPPPDLGN